jgi:hypothetical protein
LDVVLHGFGKKDLNGIGFRVLEYWIGLARTNFGLVLIVILDKGRSGQKMVLTSVITYWFSWEFGSGFSGIDFELVFTGLVN